MIKGIDCASKLTLDKAKAIKKAGYDYAIRYLGSSEWKRLDKGEAESIQKAGLKLVSVWEDNPTHDSYFTYGKGKTDAIHANAFAKQVGQPSGSAIYFAVDYDCHNMSVLKDYFRGIKANLDKSFKVGVYGSYNVLNALKGYVDYYWQTYAWSHGKVAEHAHFYQHLNGQNVGGVEVDLNKIFKSPGHWVEPVQLDYVKQKPKLTTYTVKKGDTLSEIGANLGMDWHEIAKLNEIKSPYVIYPGQKLQLTDKPKKTYMVKKGDTLSEIGARLGIDWHDIAKKNNIKSPYLIYPGQKLKY